MKDVRLWHGGKPGLVVGDQLMPGHARQHHDGCPFCEARAKGEALAGIDPASARHAVYVTSSKAYARHYASLWGRGDLYVVEPVGDLVESREDHFPTWSCNAALVVAVYQRAVLLTWTQRRQLQRMWTVADEAAAAGRVFADHGPGWRAAP